MIKGGPQFECKEIAAVAEVPGHLGGLGDDFGIGGFPGRCQVFQRRGIPGSRRHSDPPDERGVWRSWEGPSRRAGGQCLDPGLTPGHQFELPLHADALVGGG